MNQCFLKLLSLFMFLSSNSGQCPNNRDYRSICVGLSSCSTLNPQAGRYYCGWDASGPNVCCPQPVAAPITQQRCGILYSSFEDGSYSTYPRLPVVAAIVGGIPLRTATSSPWVVAIGERLQNGSVDWYCGGSLLWPNAVLTAAHCTVRRNPDTVRVGELDFSRNDDRAAPVDVSVLDVSVHPEYKPPYHYNDVAILKLTQNVEYNKFVRPICLPTPNISNQSYVGELATLVGWGYSSFGGDRSDVLQEVSVTVFNNSECNKAYSRSAASRRNYPRGIEVTQLCAGSHSGGKDACQGDSGGPLVRKDRDVHTIIGIVSSGVGCGSKAFPGVYTRVSYFTDWILRQLR